MRYTSNWFRRRLIRHQSTRTGLTSQETGLTSWNRSTKTGLTVLWNWSDRSTRIVLLWRFLTIIMSYCGAGIADDSGGIVWFWKLLATLDIGALLSLAKGCFPKDLSIIFWTVASIFSWPSTMNWVNCSKISGDAEVLTLLFALACSSSSERMTTSLSLETSPFRFLEKWDKNHRRFSSIYFSLRCWFSSSHSLRKAS